MTHIQTNQAYAQPSPENMPVVRSLSSPEDVIPELKKIISGGLSVARLEVLITLPDLSDGFALDTQWVKELGVQAYQLASIIEEGRIVKIAIVASHPVVSDETLAGIKRLNGPATDKINIRVFQYADTRSLEPGKQPKVESWLSKPLTGPDYGTKPIKANGGAKES